MPANPSMPPSDTAIDKAVRPVTEFLKLETAAGLLLMAFAVIAIAWANSAWGGIYRTVFTTPFTIGYGDGMLSKPLVLWINDGLMAIFFLIGLAWAFGRAGGRHVVVFGLLGLVAWVFMLKSGVHATIAGVLMAFALPTHQLPHETEPPGLTWEHALHPRVAFVILPLFALANAGVVISGSFMEAIAKPTSLGIIAGLVLGKPMGIFGFAWIAVKLGLVSLPAELTWNKIFGMSLLAGIGFTMSLFIADLAFDLPPNLSDAKAGVLVGSLVSGVLGFLYLRFTSRDPAPGGNPPH